MKVEVTSTGDSDTKDKRGVALAPRRKVALRRDISRARRRSVVGAVVVVCILIFATALYISSGRGAAIDHSKYQAVYLANGQAYFGKLQNTDGEYLTINGPYTAQKNDSKESEQITTLLRVRDQVYGPEDTMAIKANQVVFWQNLRDDSKISQAIKSRQ